MRGLTVGLPALLAVALAASVQPTRSSAESAYPNVGYHEGPWPSSADFKLSQDEQDLLAKVSDLIDFHKADFAAVSVQGQEIVLTATTDQGVRLAQEAFGQQSEVSIVRGPMSLADSNDKMLRMIESFPTISKKIWEAKIAPDGTGEWIGVADPIGDEELKQLDAFAEKNGIHLDIYYEPGHIRGEPSTDSRLEDGSPFAGGFRYMKSDSKTSTGTTNGWCSGGFGYENGTTDYILTAGHCLYRGGVYKYLWNTFGGISPVVNKNYIGDMAYSTYKEGTGTVVTADGETHGDVSLGDVSVADKAAGDQIWWGDRETTNKIPVVARRAPTVGDKICINGVTSGSDCGVTIVDTNVIFYYDKTDEWVFNGDHGISSNDHDCSFGGDSGGSVILNHVGVPETQATAIGIVSGAAHSDSGCDQYLTGVEEAMQAWGGDLNYN